MPIKRSPEIGREVLGRFARLSKAEWAEVFRDLYREFCGEDGPEDAWMADAERRAEILRTYREAEQRGAASGRG